jgi:predicted TIM-barrel fold metal-dependent hydrolase
MANREIDEQLAMLIDVEYEGGHESLEDAIADLPKRELERLLCLAVVEVMESRADAERDFERLVRRLEKQRGSDSNPP